MSLLSTHMAAVEAPPLPSETQPIVAAVPARTTHLALSVKQGMLCQAIYQSFCLLSWHSSLCCLNAFCNTESDAACDTMAAKSTACCDTRWITPLRIVLRCLLICARCCAGSACRSS